MFRRWSFHIYRDPAGKLAARLNAVCGGTGQYLQMDVALEFMAVAQNIHRLYHRFHGLGSIPGNRFSGRVMMDCIGYAE